MLSTARQKNVHRRAADTGGRSHPRGNPRDIYVRYPDSSEHVHLSKQPADDVGPVCSPTSEQIFPVNRHNERDLYVMDANGQNVRRVFRNGALRFSPPLCTR